MNINDVVVKLNAKVVNLPDAQKEISGGYCGDFLSWVMGRAEKDSMWFTVMNNINVAAVASLADVAVVILCEGVKPDENLKKKVKMQDIALICTDLPIYEAVKTI